MPAQCLLCRLPSQNKLICQHCHNALTHDRHCCQSCGLALNESQAVCGDCLTQTHLFTQLHALSDYKPPYPALIKKFKYGQQLVVGELLADLLSHSINRSVDLELSDVDYLLPVPLHRQKLQQRGFNQAQLLAHKLSKNLNIPLLLNVVTRNKNTNPQEKLSLSKRKINLKGAFSLSHQQKTLLSDCHVVIIDDVVTTRATVNSLSKVLLQAGVRRIDVWCLCRTALPK